MIREIYRHIVRSVKLAQVEKVLFFDQNILDRLLKKGEAQYRTKVLRSCNVGDDETFGVYHTPSSILELVGYTPSSNQWTPYLDPWIQRCQNVPKKENLIVKLTASHNNALSYYQSNLCFDDFCANYAQQKGHWELEDPWVKSFHNILFNGFTTGRRAVAWTFAIQLLAGQSLQMSLSQKTAVEIARELFCSCLEGNYGNNLHPMHLSGFRSAALVTLQEAYKQKSKQAVQLIQSVALHTNGDLVDADGVSAACLGACMKRWHKISIRPVTFVTTDSQIDLEKRIEVFNTGRQMILRDTNYGDSNIYASGSIVILDKAGDLLARLPCA